MADRYSKYWQQQFEVLAATLAEIDERTTTKASRRRKTKGVSSGKRSAKRDTQRSPKLSGAEDTP